MDRLSINDILEVNTFFNDSAFVGKIESEKAFEIGKSVFFVVKYSELKIVRGQIVGVEYAKRNSSNRFIYKIEVPSAIVVNKKKRKGVMYYENVEVERIFENAEEAKQYALRFAADNYQYHLNKIELYFSRLKKY